MPPKKGATPKVKTLKGKEARKLVETYMREQNRPYNVSILETNLHKQVGKAELTRILDTLVDEKILDCKAYKKLKYYWLNQAIVETSEEAMEELREKVKKEEAESNTLGAKLRTLEGNVSSLSSEMSNEVLRKRIVELQKENERLSGTIQKLKKGGGSSRSNADSEKILKRYGELVKEWKKRKRIVADVVGAISEGSGKNEKKLYEDIGLEKDEEYGVNIQNFVESPPPPKRRRLN